MSHLLNTFESKHSTKRRNITMRMGKWVKKQEELQIQLQLQIEIQLADIRGVIFHLGAAHISLRDVSEKNI